MKESTILVNDKIENWHEIDPENAREFDKTVDEMCKLPNDPDSAEAINEKGEKLIRLIEQTRAKVKGVNAKTHREQRQRAALAWKNLSANQKNAFAEIARHLDAGNSAQIDEVVKLVAQSRAVNGERAADDVHFLYTRGLLNYYRNKDDGEYFVEIGPNGVEVISSKYDL